MKSVVSGLALSLLLSTAAISKNCGGDAPYYAGEFSHGCVSVNRCIDEAMQTAREVCAKLGFRLALTPTRAEEILVTVSGAKQVTFVWSAPVNCSNRQP